MNKKFNLCPRIGYPIRKILKTRDMETKELAKTEKIKQDVQLVKGEFTPSEASDIINAMIDKKISFHKLQRLQLWEGNHECETGPLDGRINELEMEKRNVNEFLANIPGKGKNLKINGILEISVID